MQSALDHGAQKSCRFQRDGFSSCVRSGDHEGVELAAQAEIHRDDRRRRQQRVPRAAQMQFSVLCHFGLAGVEFVGQLRPRENHIQPDQEAEILSDFVPEL